MVLLQLLHKSPAAARLWEPANEPVWVRVALKVWIELSRVHFRHKLTIAGDTDAVLKGAYATSVCYLICADEHDVLLCVCDAMCEAYTLSQKESRGDKRKSVRLATRWKELVNLQT